MDRGVYTNKLKQW